MRLASTYCLLCVFFFMILVLQLSTTVGVTACAVRSVLAGQYITFRTWGVLSFLKEHDDLEERST